jgi:hypothetical protein
MSIEGTVEFRARVQADLDMLAASPRGQLMLAAMDTAYTNSVTGTYPGDKFAIRETVDLNGRERTVIEYTSGTAQTVRLVEYDPSFEPSREYPGMYQTPPVVVLYHELGHIYDFAYGTLDTRPYLGTDTIDHGIRNAERVAVGLPIDHDGNPSTPETQDPRHPTDLTENALRDEMGLPDRPHYRF